MAVPWETLFVKLSRFVRVRCLQSRHRRETCEFLFREYEFPVQHDFKNAAAGFDDVRFGAEFPLELVRQTGGSRPVVSHAAVGDGKLHWF